MKVVQIALLFMLLACASANELSGAAKPLPASGLMSYENVAFCINFIVTVQYGFGFFFFPSHVLEAIFTAPPIEFHETAYCLAQYLGAIYLVMFLMHASVLMGVGTSKSTVNLRMAVLNAAMGLSAAQRSLRGCAATMAGPAIGSALTAWLSYKGSLRAKVC